MIISSLKSNHLNIKDSRRYVMYYIIRYFNSIAKSINKLYKLKNIIQDIKTKQRHCEQKLNLHCK